MKEIHSLGYVVSVHQSHGKHRKDKVLNFSCPPVNEPLDLS